MESKWFLVVFLINVVLIEISNGHLQWKPPLYEAIDQSLHEDALDPELCHEQIRFIMGNTVLAMRFADAGIRVPRGILLGNTVDLGNYPQCLGITHNMEDSLIQGKYCMIRVPLNQDFELPDLPQLPEWSGFDLKALRLSNETLKNMLDFEHINRGVHAMTGVLDDTRMMPGSPLSGLTLRLAVCIPKTCSTQQAITSALFNLSAIGFEYQDDFCRLPNDKPWAVVDSVLVAICAIFGFVTLLSTCYDLYDVFVIRIDSGKSNGLCKIFSVYTNGRRLMTFTSGPGTLECLDGIRALAMIWVVLGHAFTTVPFWSNPFDSFLWIPSVEALWVTGAHITVDTFFTLSGILVVYATAGKLNGIKLLKNIHLFYLNRLLRMFPILAAAILFEASYHNRMTDGPFWGPITRNVNTCRSFWWATLLHIQNYLNPHHVCIGQTWYLAIDVQLHILSPLILFWVLQGKKRTAWIALTTGLMSILVASTVYNFIMEFPSGMMSPNRGNEMLDYMINYYMNTLTRGAPFVVGMIFGYLLHLWRDEKVVMTKIQVAFVWFSAFALTTFVMYTSYPILQIDWDNQTLDSLYNSFIRPIWAMGLGLMIFACVQGYGGPINWFLSLYIWKLPARISYAIYLFHFALMTSVNAAEIAPVYFSVDSVVFKFLAHFALTLVVSFLVTLIVDAPFSTIFKLLLGGGVRKTKPKSSEDEVNGIAKENGKRM